jgi:hypothetical protein
MPDLFECPVCKTLFLAKNAGAVARRRGYCTVCSMEEFLKCLGLAPESTDRFE